MCAWILLFALRIILPIVTICHELHSNLSMPTHYYATYFHVLFVAAEEEDVQVC